MDESQSAPTRPTSDIILENGGVTIAVAPAVGCWRLGNITLYCTERPRRLTRFLMKLLVQWQWEDVA